MQKLKVLIKSIMVLTMLLIMNLKIFSTDFIWYKQNVPDKPSTAWNKLDNQGKWEKFKFIYDKAKEINNEYEELKVEYEELRDLYDNAEQDIDTSITELAEELKVKPFKFGIATGIHVSTMFNNTNPNIIINNSFYFLLFERFFISPGILLQSQPQFGVGGSLAFGLYIY